MRKRLANPEARTRVAKDEDDRLAPPSCFETHRSALSLGSNGRASRCDAPQQGGPERQPVDEKNDGARGVPVSSLFFTGSCAT
jgi:hypothetical protein